MKLYAIHNKVCFLAIRKCRSGSGKQAATIGKLTQSSLCLVLHFWDKLQKECLAVPKCMHHKKRLAAPPHWMHEL